MPETRPISERIDLRYVRRRNWPGTWTWGLSLLLCAALLAAGAGAEIFKRAEGIYAMSIYSSGSMTRAHAMFGDDCAQCHAASPHRSGFWLPVQDDLCLKCHEVYAATHVRDPHGMSVQSCYDGDLRQLSGMSERVLMSSHCAACHIEHKGPDHDLNKVDDGICTRCHANLERDGWKGGAK